LAWLEKNLALSEFAHPDFWSLQVRHDRDFTACTVGSLAHQTGTVYVILRLAMAEVQPDHVDARPDHLLQQDWVAGGGPESGNDFGSATWHEWLSSL
jgi:hypothetical protein